MNILQLAGSLPRDPQFRTWVTSFTEDHEEVTPDQAAEFVRIVCQVESRRELATDPAAEERFHRYLRKPFIDWRNQQQSHRRAA